MSKRLRSKKAAQREQAVEASGAEEFRMDLRININAAVGVQFVRTSEPFDAMNAIEDLCMADGMPLRVWNIIRGWQEVDTKDPSLPIIRANSETADPLPALMALFSTLSPAPGQTQSAGSQSLFPQKCIAVMMWPDYYIANIPQMRATLAEIVREIQTFSQRLVLVVPPSFTLPDELAELIPILDFGLPTQTELRDLYDTTREKDATESQRANTKEFTDEDAYSVCKAGAGMTRNEFVTALCKAYVTLEKRKLRGIEAFRKIVMDTKVEVVKRSEVLEVLKPVPLNQIGGLGDLKEWIRKRRNCFSEDAVAAGVDTPKGIALIGPPGTGKSAGAKACGSAFGFPVIRFDISRVFGSLVGESEARMAKALAQLDAMAPCVAFVDEIDKVFNVNSGGGDSGTSTRVLGKILTHMQETKAPIFWILTANRVDNLPPELLRKGRVSEIFSVTTPTEDERKAILEIHLRLRGEDPADMDLDRVVAVSAQYVGAELEAAIIDAKVEAFDAGEDLTDQHLVDAVRAIRPLAVTFKDDFDRMEAWASQHARSASSERKTGGVNTPRTRTRARGVQSDPLAG